MEKGAQGALVVDGVAFVTGNKGLVGKAVVTSGCTWSASGFSRSSASLARKP